MRRSIGSFCLILGSFILLATFSLRFYNWWESQEAGERSDEVVSQMNEDSEQSSEDKSVRQQKAQEDIYDFSDSTMKEICIDGHWYIGTLYIEDFDLSLPVMSSWSYEYLKVSPCRYSGSIFTNDLVIAGHSYARHFGKLQQLSAGSFIYFIDVDHTTTEYEVLAVEVLSPFAVRDMTCGDYDLTLFTCTYGGTNRVAVRCNKSKNIKGESV